MLLKTIGNYIFGVLLIALLFIQFKQLFTVAHFFIYQDEIAAEFCENKEKPELKCDGKCHLKKELVKDSEIIMPPAKNEIPANSFEVFLFNAISFQDEITVAPLFRSNNYSIFTYYSFSFSLKHTYFFSPPPNYLSYIFKHLYLK